MVGAEQTVGPAILHPAAISFGGSVNKTCFKYTQDPFGSRDNF